VKHHGLGVVKNLLILRPAVPGHHRCYTRYLLQHLHQDRGPGKELMVAGTVALPSGYEYDLRQLWIPWFFFQGYVGLIVGIVFWLVGSSRRNECQSGKQGEASEGPHGCISEDGEWSDVTSIAAGRSFVR